jgi:Uma2 family endonuclease
MTVAEFLGWDPGDRLRYELVDGQPRAMAPPAAVHGFLQAELGRLIGNHLRATRPGCIVLANPGDRPLLMSDHNVRIPDLGVTCAPITPGQIIVAEPLLLAEILSPNNQPETWSNVWAYTTIPSVRELLVLHTSRVAAEVLRRGPDEAWPQRFEPAEDGVLRLESIGLTLPLADLYAPAGLVS